MKKYFELVSGTEYNCNATVYPDGSFDFEKINEEGPCGFFYTLKYLDPKTYATDVEFVMEWDSEISDHSQLPTLTKEEFEFMKYCISSNEGEKDFDYTSNI